MVKRFSLAAICMATIPVAVASVETSLSPMPDQQVALRAIVAAGTTTVCGMREAPHLIEHLVLSHTIYGETPVDAVLSLRAQGIKLSATTRSDFTEYTMEGPPHSALLMGEAMATFLGRSSLPKMGFEREKRTIIREVKAQQDYVSSPTFYERFISLHAGGNRPCVADGMRFRDYQFDRVQAEFERLYTVGNIRLVAQAEPGTFNLSTIATAIDRRDTAAILTSQDGQREPAESLTVEGRDGLVELLFPIAGRSSLPNDAANEMADQARLHVQAHIRREYQLYTARTFVDQSLQGGWIRLEVPDIARDKADELLLIAHQAMSAVDITQHQSDPVWKAIGSNLTPKPFAKAVIAEPTSTHEGWLKRLIHTIRNLFSA